MTYIPDLWNARNDGSGSTLDADLLDGIDSAAFLQDITGEPLLDLSDVTITAIASGEILKWNGSGWINQTLAESNISAVGHGHTASDVSDFSAASDVRIGLATISDLALTTITAIGAGEILTWDGAKWINETLSEAGIQAAGAFLTDITGEPIGDLSDVTITSIATGEILKWNGSAFINNTLAEAGIQPTGAYLLDITGEPLGDLSDVTISAVANNEVLGYDTGWKNRTLAEAGIQAAGEVADLTITAKTGAYTILLTDDVLTGDSSGGTFTFTLPTAVGNAGKLYHIKKIDSSSNVVTIDGNASETIDGSTTVPLDVEDHALTLVSDGANWLII